MSSINNVKRDSDMEPGKPVPSPLLQNHKFQFGFQNSDPGLVQVIQTGTETNHFSPSKPGNHPTHSLPMNML
jgi:hypothetical protein